MTKLNCADQKYWWTQGYENWNKEQFMRVTREWFGLILNTLSPYLSKHLTMNFVPNPIEEDPQIVLTLYCLAYSISFNILSDLFGVSISLVEFNPLLRDVVKWSDTL